MEMFACDWEDKGGNAGACWECWKCEPCCGEPCNVMDGIKCLLCWWCCGPCSGGKLLSYTVDQECAVVNHCLYTCFCGFCAHVCLRHNLRQIHGVGDPDDWIGDVVMTCFCSSCSMCQLLRSVDRDTWNWLDEFQEKGMNVMADEFKFVHNSSGGE